MQEVYLYNKNKSRQPKLNVWCAYPAVYNFAMSSLGYLSVFKNIDNIQDINAERIYTDTEKTSIFVENVDVISFSFSFELDYLGILSILKKYKIPYLAEERDENFPLIYGGGPVLSANPEPFARFFDFIMIGDAEPYLNDIFEILRDNKDKSKKEKLELLSKIGGVYIPSFKHEDYIVKKSHSNLEYCISTPIISEHSFFPNTFIVEVERGCPQKCAFCLTSYINSPIRFSPYEKIIEQIEYGLKYTNKIALLGALICSHPRIDDICQYIIDKVDSGLNLEVTVSSLRADYVSDKTLEMLRKCGQNTATIAIEAGSERLRNVINKHLSDKNIMDVVERMVKYGFSGLKIYGIIGLPTETYDDLDAFVNLCSEIKKKYKGFTLTPSFSTFIPKAQTPFQYAEREDTLILEKKNEYIKKQFAKIGIKARTGSVKWDNVQTLLSRGGRELTPYLISVFEAGANLGAFKNTYKDYVKQGRLPDYKNIALDNRKLNAKLPWDFIRFFEDISILKNEYIRLMQK